MANSATICPPCVGKVVYTTRSERMFSTRLAVLTGGALVSNPKKVSLAELRQRIRVLEGSGVARHRKPCGVACIDTLLGGLPLPGLVELCGALGSGVTRLALAVLAAQLGRVAWVDTDHSLYPPAAAALGVVLSRLLLIRPTGGRGIAATETLVRAGCFGVVVFAGQVTTPHAGRRWERAAQAGRCTVLVISRRPVRALPTEARLVVDRNHITVQRNRGGSPGQQAPLPPLVASMDPWA